MGLAIPGLIGLGILLLISFYLSAAQACLSSVSRHDLKERINQGARRAELALRIAEDSTRVLSTFQLATVIIRFLIAALVAMLLLPPFADWSSTLLSGATALSYAVGYLVIIPVVGLLIFILTGLVPQILGQNHAEALSIALAPLAQVTIILLVPLVNLMAGLRRWMAGPLGGTMEGSFVTEEAIKTMIDAGEEEGSIDLEEKEMLYSILDLDETLAREIMVPRIDVVALDIDTELEEAREVIIDAGHSRIPVYEESLDHIMGLLYAKDLLDVWHQGRETVDLGTLLRPALFVPESKRVSDLLRELQSRAVHLAIVIDEYGGTAGLVTIEDIVEEIVGEIIDEYDQDEEAAYIAISEDEYIMDARIDLDDLSRLLHVELPDEMSDTLGGFIYGQLGKVPEGGETVQTSNLHLEVLSVENQRIGKVRVKRVTPPQTPADSGDKRNHVSNGSSR